MILILKTNERIQTKMTPGSRERLAAVFLTGAALLPIAACGSADDADTPSDGLDVVATTAVLGDVVAGVAGDGATVHVLIDRDQDPHGFSASAADIGVLSNADLVVANGLSLEAGIVDTLAAVEAEGTAVIRVAELVDPLPFSGSAAVTHGLDPHFWHDPIRMVAAADLVASALSELDPETSAVWHENATAVATEILQTHDHVAEILASIDPANRKLVTNHDSLSYLASRYGFEVVATVIPGGTTVGSPSAADLADLVEALHDTGLTAVFAETTQSDDLARAVAAELGHNVAVISLYSGGLGPIGSPAETYVGMLVVNAESIVTGLAG
jgi:zinc/manganese transport system substrate-binding protein